MTVPRSEEEYYRKAAKLITDRYNAYAQAYKGKKGEHTIALMTLIDIALMLERERGKNDTAPYDGILAKLTSEIEELKARVTQADNDYNSLKMARMLEITDGNLDEAKERLSRMIRQVNKCIAILSDEQ